MSPPVSTEVDELFKLPLGEFTPARNALAAQLKKAGRQAEASAAKTLAKPSVSAWVVNQLYWRHRGLFDRLIEAGDRMRRAQAGQIAGDSAREAANARREAVTALGKIAEGLLLGAKLGATRDLLRRVTTTLDALSSYGSLPNAPSAGRLTDDVEPPGFEALVGLPAGGKKRPVHEPPSRTRPQRAALATKAVREQQRAAERAARRAEQERRKALAAAEVAVRDAERTLKAARKQAERAATRLESATADFQAATAAVATAERTLELARRQLQR
jgi:hypothetical protein